MYFNQWMKKAFHFQQFCDMCKFTISVVYLQPFPCELEICYKYGKRWHLHLLSQKKNDVHNEWFYLLKMLIKDSRNHREMLIQFVINRCATNQQKSIKQIHLKFSSAGTCKDGKLLYLNFIVVRALVIQCRNTKTMAMNQMNGQRMTKPFS